MEDKKLIKMSIGTTEDIAVDTKVLSVNVFDKTYNNDNLDDVDIILKKS